MIHDAKGGLWTWLLRHYLKAKLRSAFRGLWIRGTLPSSEGGLIPYANHTSFWDGFVVHQLGQLAGWDGYALMEEANLARYRFHTRIGAIGIRRGDPQSALEMLRYVRAVMKRPRAALVIFPEGELRAGAQDVGELERGLEVIARVTGVRSVPIAIRYAFFDHEHPDVLIDVGEPHLPVSLAESQERLRAVHARVSAARSLDGFTLAIAGRTSVQERWDTFRRMLSAPQR